MKKILSMILALSLVLSLAACGGNAAEPTTEAAVSVDATCEELVNSIIEKQPVEFMGGDNGGHIVGFPVTDCAEHFVGNEFHGYLLFMQN